MKKCKDERFVKLEEKINEVKDNPSKVIICLQEAQIIFGYICEEILEFISKGINVSVQRLYEVASFYPQFKLGKVAKHKISVCMGTACYVKGSQDVLDSVKKVTNLEEGETTEDGYFSLDTVRCIGCCALAPVMTIDDELFPKIDSSKVEEKINDFKLRHKD